MTSTPAPADRLMATGTPGPHTSPDPPGTPVPCDLPIRPAAPDMAVHAMLTIPGRPEHVATARRFVTVVLGDDHPQADTAILLTSELVTNSLRHSASARPGAQVCVAASRAPGWLRVEVTDDGSATLPALRQADRNAEQGRGLALVDALATRWDTRRDDSGTVTWFEIAA